MKTITERSGEPLCINSWRIFLFRNTHCLLCFLPPKYKMCYDSYYVKEYTGTCL